LADLKKGLRNYDAVLVAKLAHQIKGASANVGIEAIAEIARSLQANAKSHHIKVADGLIGDLNQLNSLLQQLNNYVADLKLRNGSSAEYREHLGKISRWQTTSPPGARSTTATAYDLILDKVTDKVTDSITDNIIDSDRLQQISFGDRQFIEKLLGAFISNTEMYLEQAIAAFASNDMETLARRTHQIKGSSSTVGVRFMPEIAAKVQKYKSMLNKINRKRFRNYSSN